MMNWYCIRTKAKKELHTSLLIESIHGYETFCPIISEWKKTQTAEQFYTSAMFRGYIFVRFEDKDCYWNIQYTQGVSGVVKYGNNIPLVPERFISEIRSELNNDVLVLDRKKFKTDEYAEVAIGPFRSQIGRIIKCDNENDRVDMLLEILGRSVSVKFNSKDLRVVRT